MTARRPYCSIPWSRRRRLRSYAASVREEGLGFDSCDVSIVTNVGQDHRDDLSDAETVEQISVLQRCVVEATVKRRGFAVLNADDPTVVGMASYCRGAVIFYSRDRQSAHVAAHRGQGGRVAWSSGQKLYLAEAGQAPLEISLPIGTDGQVDPVLAEYALPAAAAAWALGISVDEISRGLTACLPQPAVA